MRACHLVVAVCALLALSLLAACSDKEALPLKGSSPIPRGKSPLVPDARPGEAGVKDSATTDSSAVLDGAATDGATGAPCTVDCDCVQGQACFNKKCSTESFPYYCCNKSGCVSGLNCTDYLGQPGTCGSTGFCLDQCDCPQGLTCVSSLCTVTSSPTYCCTKTGCPSGLACLNLNGSSGTCP